MYLKNNVTYDVDFMNEIQVWLAKAVRSLMALVEIIEE